MFSSAVARLHAVKRERAGTEGERDHLDHGEARNCGMGVEVDPHTKVEGESSGKASHAGAARSLEKWAEGLERRKREKLKKTN